jgi:tetratricopeptide (TPR) repeat protein
MLLRDALAASPREAGLQMNLAFILAEQHDLAGALAAYEAACALQPDELEPHIGRATMLVRLVRNDEAEAAFRDALRVDPLDVRANLAVYELRNMAGDPAGALPFQSAALRRQRLFSAFAPDERRRVLVLCAPGDLTANIPVDFLLDAATTTVHKLYLVDADGLRGTVLPEYDVLLNAIAESPECALPFALAERVIAAQHKPVLNVPARVLATKRTALPAAVAATDASLAPIAEVSRVQLIADGSPLPLPIIIRPTGSHAGHGLARIDEAAALRAYLDEGTATEFFVSAYVDYRSEDGYFRKYRVILVDGEPYPCHLAVSPRWMVHYYNAGMAENAWMRAEEERFLSDLPTALGPQVTATLRAVARALDLDYVGVDCTVDRDGRLFIFEADPAMVVHVSDDAELYPYKRAYVPRIFRAVERMLDARIGSAVPA